MSRLLNIISSHATTRHPALNPGLHYLSDTVTSSPTWPLWSIQPQCNYYTNSSSHVTPPPAAAE